MSEVTLRKVRAEDGLSLCVRDYWTAGSVGVPLFCLAGLTRNGGDFDKLAKRLSPRRRVVALDYRGRGLSNYDTSGKSYDPRQYLMDARQVMVALGMERAVFCGTSLGAFLTMGAAVMMPTALAGAILNDAGPDLAPGGIERILAYIEAVEKAPPASLEEAVPYLKKLLPTLAFQNDRHWQDMVEKTFRQKEGRLIPDWDPALLQTLKKGAALPDLWAYFQALTPFPTLAFRGAQSDVLTLDCFDKMRQRHRAMRQVVVAETGHAPTLAEPECQTAIDNFLEQIDQMEHDRPH